MGGVGVTGLPDTFGAFSTVPFPPIPADAGIGGALADVTGFASVGVGSVLLALGPLFPRT